jgi:hypothetical protein
MSDTEFDVVIAAYLIPDLAQQDFDALVNSSKTSSSPSKA